ncbi:hypothetical protein B7463_g8002, partial [Scytalidium lignicola]
MGSIDKSAPLDWTSFYNIIDGNLETTAKTRHSINPATGQAGPEVPLVDKNDVERAMPAAKRAAETWAEVPYSDRQKAILAFTDAIEVEKQTFISKLTEEQGKPLHFSSIEIDLTLHWMRTMAKMELPEEKTIEADKEVVIRYTPLGVAVALIPWNYPILLAAAKIVPAVVTGNTIIVKPSPFTPAGGLKLCELAQRFFPPGVVQGLSGDDSLGPLLTEHSLPAKISFTGSTFTGKKVMESASKTLKRVTLELGGNDPAIICDDVDIADVAPKVASLDFLNSGQLCLAIKRIYVDEKIVDKFIVALNQATKKLQVGPGNQPGVKVGPLQNAPQYERVKGFFADIEKENWKVEVGGTIPDGPGYFITPTIINRPNENSRIVTEEPFGPIVPVLTFSSDQEAIKNANNSKMGLGASVWSSNIDRANKIAHKLEAGSVWVNTHFEIDPRMPFGGHKESGIGVEWGIAGLKSFYQQIIDNSIDELDAKLRDISRIIHENPELGYSEFQAHSNIVEFLQALGFKVTPHTYGLETSFTCEYGSGGRVVAINAEYDALPGIGHACGHNLIATGSIAAFLGVVSVIRSKSISGRVRLIGTPAEEGGGGKIKLIKAGAYKDIDACLMAHPFSIPHSQAYGTCLASSKFRATFKGKPAHAAAAPHEGINALDAAVLAYTGTSLLRQQIKPDQRIQGVLLEGGLKPNIITPKSVLDYNVRGSTLGETKELQERVVKCFEGAAIATGCTVEFEETNTYAELRPNRPMCVAFFEAMKGIDSNQIWHVGDKPEPGAYSTDQGNVSHIVPSIHPNYKIPVKDNAPNHTVGFTDAAGTDEAYKLTIATSKGMAAVGVKFLADDQFAKEVRDAFEADQKGRESQSHDSADVIQLA